MRTTIDIAKTRSNSGGRPMLMILGESCHNGPCPTLYRDTRTGEVKVQGYITSMDERRLPAGEDVVAIPAAAWARLLADLPVSMLLRALVAPWRYRSRGKRAVLPVGQ